MNFYLRYNRLLEKEYFHNWKKLYIIDISEYNSPDLLFILSIMSFQRKITVN